MGLVQSKAQKGLNSSSALALVTAVLLLPASARGADTASAPTNAAPNVEVAATTQSLAPDSPQVEKVVISGSLLSSTQGVAVNIAPSKEPLDTTQPMSTIDRTFIENSVPDTSDYTGTLVVSPSTAGVSNNGPGLSEKDATVRGFGDGEYNVTYDGIPFGDTNDPTHHTTAYFPASTIGAVQVNRGPGHAGDLGQASLGGSIDLFSRGLTDEGYAQQKVTYGSWNTWNFVTTLMSGKLEDFGNVRATANFQELSSDGYLTYASVREYNQFLKVAIPLGSNWTLTGLTTHNSGKIHQPDNDGITLAQAATYGKNFSMSNNPALPTYYGYNTVKKETDFEYLRLQGTVTDNLMVEDTGYTYSYINDTLSATDTTQSANDIANNTYPDWGTKAGPAGNQDVAGYDKLNAYRVWGNIARFAADFDVAGITGQARGGLWYEIAETDRHRYDRDWTLGFIPNPIEKAPAGISPPPDPSIQFFERSSWTHYEPFFDLELHPVDGLTVTPGIKYVHLTRNIAAPIGSKTRTPQYDSATYTRTLPFLSANYRVNENWSLFAQYAQGFLIPPLKAFYVPDPKYNNLKPQTSQNYQAGTVYNVNNLTFDADVYYVHAVDAFQSGNVPVPGGGFQKAYFNSGNIDYKGVEAEGTYAVTEGPLDGLAVFANGSINSAQGVTPGNSDYHKQIKQAPEWTAAFGFIYNMHNFSVSLVDKFVGQQWGDSGQPAAYKIPTYSVANLVLGYEFFRWAKIQVGVYNLLDNRSVTDISVNDGPTPTDPNSHDQFWWVPARSYQITLRATLD